MAWNCICGLPPALAHMPAAVLILSTSCSWWPNENGLQCSAERRAHFFCMLIAVALILVSMILKEDLEAPPISGLGHHSGRWAPVPDPTSRPTDRSNDEARGS